jgi:DNA-binding response OmpR family regulator
MRTAVAHILVVDDNESILESVAMVLRWNAFRVSTTDKLIDFHASVREMQPDLIVLDKALGWADGCELCREIKSDVSTGHIRVIMISAFSDQRTSCLSAGADAFLEKPFDINDLLRLVNEFTTPMLLPM